MGGVRKPPAAVRPADGALFRILQMLHASVQAGWWETADGKRARFSQLAEQLLAPMGITTHYIRQYLAPFVRICNSHAVSISICDAPFPRSDLFLMNR